MAALGAEIFSLGFRFNPKPLEATSYYLPRLIPGAPLHGAVRPFVHHADVYACEPSELARQFRPLPVTGHRFFFTSCKKGVRVAGPGSWALQSSKAIKDAAGAKVGEIKKLRYKKQGVFTDWLMDEASTCGLEEEAVVGDRQLVFCKMYVSPKADSDSPAHQESAAFFAPPPAPVVMVAEPPCPKRMRRVAVAPSHPLVQPKQQQQMPPPTPPVVRACHMPVQAPARHCRPQPSVQRKQRILDPFEAMTDEADDEGESPATLEDDDDSVKSIEDALSEAEAEEEAAANSEGSMRRRDGPANILLVGERKCHGAQTRDPGSNCIRQAICKSSGRSRIPSTSRLHDHILYLVVGIG